uniref:Uncharacterized protein n=1 Tax=Myoviridae sp. ctTK08 TaxID=2826656 RepID=A0A8S5QWS2_9CAUD|nr:MAG TPA: hypothetical protein [Myoviridae sp. ctTK08]
MVLLKIKTLCVIWKIPKNPLAVAQAWNTPYH